MRLKKILLFVAVMMMSALSQVWAQNAVGDWRIHTSFVGSEVAAVAEANEWIYYLAGGNLFRLDKRTQENEALSIANDLSDMGIKQIYYNSDKDYLVVVYDNANIDVIQTDGSVVNMPEIKDAVTTMSKNINHVTFASGLIYVATDFGYVVIDDKKFVIKESHLYGVPTVSVAQVGNKVLLTTADTFYWGDANKYHDQLSSFTPTNLRHNSRIWPINDHTFFCMASVSLLATMWTDQNGELKFESDTLLESRIDMVQKTPDGFLLNVSQDGKCYITDEDGDIISEVETSGEMCSANPRGDGSLWAAGENGLHLLQDKDNYYLPNALSFSTPFWMTYNKSRDLLFVSSPTANAFYKNVLKCNVNTFDGIAWHDVTPEGAPKNGTYWIEFLPDDDNTYFIGGWTTGLHKVTDNKIVLTYNAENSPMVKYKGAMHPITSIDRNGNVWVVQSFENEEHPVMVLPASKAKLDQVTVEDWLTPEIDGTYSKHTQRASFLSTRYNKEDVKVFTDGDFEMPIILWNTGGGIPSRPQQQASYSKLLDQDGQYFSWTYIMCLAEDLNGMVWMGTTEGIIMFNPAQAFSGDFRANHIKVPRNDGTGMADYLLDGIQVNGIAVDGANRKWIATQTSGLFLVSADGTQIISKFNTTNSPLASNTVYKVCCDPNSNSVFVTTPQGLYEYFSDSTPAESSYNNIYAYPNPVRPEYSGNVTITGMMDNSLIKIADSNGYVIRQLKSTGGMATWDCCDQYGERVKTGVYLVLCSQANGGSEAVVTKIAVIR